MKKLITAIALVFTTTSLQAESPGRLTVTWFDMQVHGLAVVLESPSGEVFLVDTGGRDDKAGYIAARDVVAPWLRSRGHQKIAGIAVSHPHTDHYGGVEWWLTNWPVKQFIDSGYEGRAQTNDYRKLRTLATDRGAEYLAVHAGQKLDWGEDLDVEVLSPPKEFLELQSDPKKVSDHGLLNGNSMVLRVRHGENVLLFPGDAYGMGQRFLLANHPADTLRATVVTAPHHGFNSSPEFVQAARPKVVIASCLSDYPGSEVRSPADKAVEMYSPIGAQVFATCWHGNIQLVSDAKTVAVTTERERNVEKK